MVTIKNLTKRAIISENAELCKGAFSKSFGLMFSLKPKPLIFAFKKEKIVPLHMFFVFFQIDALFLDKNKKVVEIKESFRPFEFYNPKKKARYVVELPQGTVKKTGTKLLDKLGFSINNEPMRESKKAPQA